MVQPDTQSDLTTRMLGLGGPASPCGPCGPGGPGGPIGPAGPASPLGPCGPAGPVSPCAPLPQPVKVIDTPASNATASAKCAARIFGFSQVLEKDSDSRAPASYTIKLGCSAQGRCQQKAKRGISDQFTAVQVPSGLRQAGPRAACGAA